MKKINITKGEMAEGLPKRSFIGWIQQNLSSWIKSQNCSCADEIEEIYRQLQKMDELIDVLAREVNRLGNPSD